MSSWIDKKTIDLVNKAIITLDLDLQGRTVLTEVGSGMYNYTPLIPALAGAKRVFACSGDSRYAKGDDNIDRCRNLAHSLGIDSIEFYNNNIPYHYISETDIITNSGFLRPLNKTLLQHINPGKTVIPLMFEAWEIRTTDIDIDFCRQRGIKVAGTWENHPSIRVFDSVGILAIKMALEAGYEVFQNNIVVWGDDHFGKQAFEAFQKLQANRVTLVNDIEMLARLLPDTDFVFICDYHAADPYFGEGGLFHDLEKELQNNLVGVIHLYGHVDSDYLIAHEINVFPRFKGETKKMTLTLGHVGLRPLLNLQTAGFKVAQEMLTQRLSPLSQPIT